MTRAFLSANGKASELPFAEAVAQFGHADLVWLHFDGRDAAAREWLAAQADIPDIAQTALVAAETRPRCDIIGHGAIINLRGLGKTPEDDPDSLVSTRFWAETGRVISLTFRSSMSLDEVIDDFLGGGIADPGDLLSAWAGAITDGLDPDVAALGDALDDLEVKLESPTRRQVSRIRGEAIAYRRFVAPQRMALERLATNPCNWLDDDDRLHLREAADRFARMAEELESVRERAAIVHEELTDLRAEQMDGRALLISIVALIFLPLTFITGVFGMNFDVMPLIHSGAGFWQTMVVCAVGSLALAGYFLHAHWVDR